jgi:hypothetical protein
MVGILGVQKGRLKGDEKRELKMETRAAEYMPKELASTTTATNNNQHKRRQRPLLFTPGDAVLIRMIVAVPHSTDANKEIKTPTHLLELLHLLRQLRSLAFVAGEAV